LLGASVVNTQRSNSMKKRAALSSFLIAISLVMIPGSAPAAEYPAFGASCEVGGNSSFTAAKRGFYAWVWRTGSIVNSSGVQYFTAGQVVTISTPVSTTTSTRFGVLTGSKTFAYITCVDFLP
jgi:hypothetical protein